MEGHTGLGFVSHRLCRRTVVGFLGSLSGWASVAHISILRIAWVFGRVYVILIGE